MMPHPATMGNATRLNHRETIDRPALIFTAIEGSSSVQHPHWIDVRGAPHGN
jgi:hypothetical protein